MFKLKKRGRQVGANGEESRKLLLNIAAAQFALNGFHKTKISEIVKEADVTQPTFYLYFKSKDAIFQELIDVFKEKLYTHVEESRIPLDIEDEDLQERISHAICAVFDLFQENEEVARIGFVVSEESAEIKRFMAARIKKNLVEEAKDGHFHSELDLGIAAAALVGSIEYLAVTKLWPGIHTAKELAEDMSKLFLNGLKSKK